MLTCALLLCIAKPLFIVFSASATTNVAEQADIVKSQRAFDRITGIDALYSESENEQEDNEIDKPLPSWLSYNKIFKSESTSYACSNGRSIALHVPLYILFHSLKGY